MRLVSPVWGLLRNQTPSGGVSLVFMTVKIGPVAALAVGTKTRQPTATISAARRTLTTLAMRMQHSPAVQLPDRNSVGKRTLQLLPNLLTASKDCYWL